MFKRLAISVVTTLLLCSCAGYKVRVGAPDKASSIAFDTLTIAHQVIESAKLENQSNDLTSTEKNLLDDLIKVYNIATVSLGDYDKAVRMRDPNINSFYTALLTAMGEVNKAVIGFKQGGK